MKIARCTPSRGLIHSRTEAAAETARVMACNDGHQWRNFWSHDEPIPECFNSVVGRAWDWDADVIWLLEEDVAPASPAMTFAAMWAQLEAGADYVTTTYPIGTLEGGGTSPLNYDGAGRLVWCATGCILLRRRCFELMPRPWFTLRNRLVKPGTVTWDEGENSPYGADIGFTFALYQLGLQAAAVWDEMQHLKVRQTGQVQKNQGYHIIEPLAWAEGVTKWQY